MYKTRSPLLFIFFHILICTIFYTSAVSGLDGYDKLIISGSTYLWEKILKRDDLKPQFYDYIQKSMQDIVNDSEIKVEIKRLDATGPRLIASYTSNDAAKTKPVLFIDKPIAHIMDLIISVIETMGLHFDKALIPKACYYRKVLPPRQNHTYTFDTEHAHYDMFLSGGYEDWLWIESNAHRELTEVVQESVITSLYRLNHTVSVEVEQLVPELKSLVVDKGGERAGIRIRIFVTQESHAENLHLYSEFEANSMLMLLNCTKINSIYNKYSGFGKKNKQIRVMAVRDVPSSAKYIFQEYKLLFYGLAVDVAIIIFILLLTVMYICSRPKKPQSKLNRRGPKESI